MDIDKQIEKAKKIENKEKREALLKSLEAKKTKEVRKNDGN